MYDDLALLQRAHLEAPPLYSVSQALRAKHPDFPLLMTVNEFREEATYRLTGKVEMDGQPNLSLTTMQASGDMPMPAPMHWVARP